MATMTSSVPGSSQEPGACSGCPIWMAGARYLGHLQLLPLVHECGAGLEVKQPGWKLMPVWNTGVAGSGFTYNASTLQQLLSYISECVYSGVQEKLSQIASLFAQSLLVLTTCTVS